MKKLQKETQFIPLIHKIIIMSAVYSVDYPGFNWTVIDHDRLFPHNIARHTAGKCGVMRNKAELVAGNISQLLVGPETAAHAIPADVFAAGEKRDEIDHALKEADLIIDATASVLAARFVSDHAADARRISVFFNPEGDAVCHT